ncbi:MAG: response regulator [Treponema sp.]|nr:response regulator [Treponema sp.]
MKKEKYKSIYLQIIFTFLAFAVMVVLSYLFNSRTVRDNLFKNAGTVLSFTHEQIESELTATRMMLGTYAQTARMIIMNGDADNLQNFTNIISAYAMSNESGLYSINGLYGYFENVFDEGVYIDGIYWAPSDDYIPYERVWYRDAIANCGRIVETEPYMDAITGNFIISYSLCIHDDDGLHLGVVAIDIPMERIGDIVMNAALSDGGYGMLTAADLTIISYANEKFIGSRLGDLDLVSPDFVDILLREDDLYEYHMKNWRNESVIAFSRAMPNGWYLILLSPRDRYYEGTTQMLIVLCALGVILASALVGFLIHIDNAKNKADEESKQKSAFLANMSHEIRTPMNAIIGMTFIGKSANDVPRKNYCLEKIENASQHLLGVINDILDMSKIEAGMFELSEIEFNFEKMLQRVISVVGFRAEEKKQNLSVYVDKTIPRSLIGDDQRLAQVVTNLLGNAVKFTPEGGAIKIDTRFVGEEDGVNTVRLTVSDSGIGISEEARKKLFHSFQQADSGTSRKFGGTGLGLVISKNIIEMMGGKIELDSQPGKGSSFSFTFKAKRGSKSPGLSELGINWSNVTVMAIDDDKEVLDYFSDVMKGFGTNCDTALNGKDALSHIDNSGARHIYFIDWKMPDMDGITLAKEVKARSKSPNDTIIFMISAAEWSNIAEEAKNAGIDKFLSKPLFPSAIADAITEAIGVSHLEVEKKSDYSGVFEGYKILLAEDVDINREIIDTLIEPTLLKMDIAENGIEAVEMYRKSPFDYDLILMDVQMPEMDGYEATKKIREIEAGMKKKHIPIIAMTANVFSEDIKACHDAGMDDHIGKPIDVEDFFRMMKLYMPKL